MKYLVAIQIPEPFSSEILLLKSQLQPPHWRDTMPPHITLLPPGQPIVDPIDAITKFRNLNLTIEPEKLKVGGIDRFDRGPTHTIYMKVEPLSWLRNIRNQVLERCSWQTTGPATKHQFEPHVTLANQLDHQQLALAEPIAYGHQIRCDFICDYLTLYAKRNHWLKWVPISRLSLHPQHKI